MSNRKASIAALGAFEWIAIHSLAWLFVANLVGLLLATLLLFPSLGAALGALTYGRWVPLHLDLHLYGWCSLPAVGLLLHFYLPPRGSEGDPRSAVDRLAKVAVTAWSATLLFGALSWLAGGSSGKLFLEWSGPARIFLVATLGLLALVLAFGFARQLATGTAGTRRVTLGKATLLAALCAIPAILYWAAGADVYPSFNPDSGGSTGGSLLGSTLGLVTIFCLTPLLLGLKLRGAATTVRRTFVLLGLHLAWFLLLDHGNRSHHEWLQIASLGSLVVWLPLLKTYLQAFDWGESSRRWLGALAFWGVLLVLTGVLGFLPGLLERWKFTNALVGHAHIAMAGLITSFNALLLLSFRDRPAPTSVLVAARPFELWHLGLGAQVIALFALGTLEGFDPGFVIRWHPLAAVLYGLRWLGGAAMVVASWQWLAGALGSSAEVLTPTRRHPGPDAAAVKGVA